MADQATKKRIIIYLVVGGIAVAVALGWRISKGNRGQTFARMQALCDSVGIKCPGGAKFPEAQTAEFVALCVKLADQNNISLELPPRPVCHVQRFAVKDVPGGNMSVEFLPPEGKPDLEALRAMPKGALLILPGGRCVEQEEFQGQNRPEMPAGMDPGFARPALPGAAAPASGPATREG